MPKSSVTRKSGFVASSHFIPQTLKIKCKCGGVFEVSLSDVSLKEHILSKCCNEDIPLDGLRQTINNYIHYVDSRAELIGKGWDVELPIEPGCRPVA
jgi:MoaA/NifB/PqqE/SkfB family radical SAM enzyme